ncbi:MAG: hypothetical protein ABSH49_12375 [Bryobacteraceae bacterium]
MKWLFRFRLRHPLFPTLAVTFAGPRISRCAVLAGRLEDLRRAAVRGTRVSRSVCVVCGLNEPPLRSSDRAALWYWFQVPVYRMLLDPTGRLAGYECEALDGFHLDASVARAGVRIPGANLEETPCPCGRPGPRLVERTASVAA